MCRQFDSSQHHGNPLIISGFLFLFTLLFTLFGFYTPFDSIILCATKYGVECGVFEWKLHYTIPLIRAGCAAHCVCSKCEQKTARSVNRNGYLLDFS